MVFDGQAGQFKHEKGAEYVARLLVERGPIHALELATKGGGGLASPGQAGRMRKRRAEASLREVMELGGRVQERSPALDDSEARQRLLDYRRRCEAVVMDKNVSESNRAAAQRDLEMIVKFLRSQPGRPTDNAQRAARAVRMAIKRFHHMCIGRAILYGIKRSIQVLNESGGTRASYDMGDYELALGLTEKALGRS